MADAPNASHTVLRLRLSDLVVNSSDIQLEMSQGGGLPLFSNTALESIPEGEQKAVCVMRGRAIEDTADAYQYVPHISLGSLALR